MAAMALGIAATSSMVSDGVAGATSAATTSTLAPGTGAISVTDQITGAPCVVLFDSASNEVGGGDVTSGGSFSFTGLTPGSYSIYAMAECAEPEYNNQYDDSFEFNGTITVTAGQTTDITISGSDTIGACGYGVLSNETCSTPPAPPMTEPPTTAVPTTVPTTVVPTTATTVPETTSTSTPPDTAPSEPSVCRYVPVFLRWLFALFLRCKY
jgi:hypothetical protein